MRDDVSRAAFGLLLAYGIALGLPGPAVPSLQAAFDLDHRGAALHLTLFSLGALGGSAAAGRLGRTVTRRVLVRGALLGLALGGALVAVAPAAPVSLLGTATMGLFGIVAVNVGQGVLGERHGARSAAALSDGHVVSALGLAAAALAVAVARAVDAGGGWRIAFLAPAVAIVALLLARQPDRLPHREPDRATDGATDGATGGATGDAVPASPPAAPASPPGAHRAAASPPGASAVASPGAVRLGAAVTGLCVGVEWAVTFWATTYLRDEAGLPTGVADVATVGVLGGLVAGRVLVGRLARRRAAHRLLLGALLVVLVASVPYLVGPGIAGAVGTAASVVALVVLCPAVAALFPLALALTMAAATGPGPGEQERASALALGAGAVVGTVVPYALGALADATSLRAALLAVPVSAVLAAAGALAARRAVRAPASGIR